MVGKTGKIAIVVAAVVLVGGVAGAFVFLGGGGDTVTEGGDTEPTGTESGDTGGDTSGEQLTATPQMGNTSASFAYAVDSIEKCGQTCRDVTATITNDGNETATNVTVETNIYTDGDLIWEGSEDIGMLKAGAEYTSTQRVELSYGDAAKVEDNNGWITIETIVRFDGGQEVITEERQVS
ncbi:MAG: FxLYD domain-containing protein [Halopenitus sp.]